MNLRIILFLALIVTPTISLADLSARSLPELPASPVMSSEVPTTPENASPPGLIVAEGEATRESGQTIPQQTAVVSHPANPGPKEQDLSKREAAVAERERAVAERERVCTDWYNRLEAHRKYLNEIGAKLQGMQDTRGHVNAYESVQRSSNSPCCINGQCYTW